MSNSKRENLPLQVDLECIENVINQVNEKVRQVVRIPVVEESKKLPTRHAKQVEKLREMIFSEK